MGGSPADSRSLRSCASTSCTAAKKAATAAKKAEKAAAAQAKKAEKEAAKKTKKTETKKTEAKPKREKALSAKAYLEKHGQESVGAIENGKQLCLRKSGVPYWKPGETVAEPEVVEPVVEKELVEDTIVPETSSSAVEAEVEEAASEEEDEEEVQVTKWTCPADAEEYLLAADNVVYDASTHEPVGVWNEKEGKIDELVEEEE